MEKKNFKITAVVILYFPEKEVLKNIRSYSDKVDTVYAIDNSDTISFDVVKAIKRINNVKYFSFGRNEGIANALNYAANIAIEDGADYLLTMDQDSYAANDMVSKMLLATKYYNNIGIISPFFENKYQTHKPSKTQFTEILFEKTSGNLLNLSSYIKAGPFDEGFFIDYVDLEYCMRLNLMGLKVIQVNDALLYHNEADISKNKFLFFTVYPMNHSPRRLYYKIRNLLYFRDEYRKYYPAYFRHEFNKHIKLIIKILFYEKNKLLKYKYMIEGYNSYKKGIKGEYQPLN